MSVMAAPRRLAGPSVGGPPVHRHRADAAVRTGEGEHRWPLRYAVRRLAWHVLDHAWEIEDKQPEEP